MVVQLVRMPPCHGGGRGFESRPFRKILQKSLIINDFCRLWEKVHTVLPHNYEFESNPSNSIVMFFI
jgi:hypothetical protein